MPTPPMCRLCQKRHWTYEPHKLSAAPMPETVVTHPIVGKRQPVTEAVTRTDSESSVTLTAHCETCTCNANRNGRSDKKYSSNAQRQKAYRGRRGT